MLILPFMTMLRRHSRAQRSKLKKLRTYAHTPSAVLRPSVSVRYLVTTPIKETAPVHLQSILVGVPMGLEALGDAAALDKSRSYLSSQAALQSVETDSAISLSYKNVFSSKKSTVSFGMLWLQAPVITSDVISFFS